MQIDSRDRALMKVEGFIRRSTEIRVVPVEALVLASDDDVITGHIRCDTVWERASDEFLDHALCLEVVGENVLYGCDVYDGF
jgi:hypothetical protein